MSEVGIFRPVQGRLIVSGPASWLRWSLGLRLVRAPSGDSCWLVPRVRFREIVRAACAEFPVVRVIDERKKSTRACDTRCIRAKGDDCECVCGGKNHGGLQGLSSLELVGETALFETDIVRFEYVYRKLV